MKKTISAHAAAAKEIRTELKKFGIKARVKASSASMTSSVDIYLNNTPPHILDAITSFCNQYQYGHFNGMDDCYYYSNRQDLPQVKFVFVNNNFSDDIRQAAWTELRNRLEGMDQYHEDVEQATNNYDAQSELWRYMNGSDKSFMFSQFQKPRQAA